MRTVSDDGLCTDVWSALMNRSSNDDLMDESMRELQAIFTDVKISRPRRTQTKNMIGEAFHIDRLGSIDAAAKSLVISRYSRFHFENSCFQGDGALQGPFCNDMFVCIV